MNCKQGDLAVIVSARYTPELIGHIVQCIGPYHGKVEIENGDFAWEVCYPDGREIVVVYSSGKKTFRKTRPFNDRCLRPIRDSKSDDETFQWAGKPQKEQA